MSLLTKNEIDFPPIDDAAPRTLEIATLALG